MCDASVSMSANKRPVFLDFTIKVMFHMGLWIEDPNPELNDDLNYYSPWLTRFVLRHPNLRASLRVLRAYYPWLLVGQTIISSMPCVMKLYFYRHDMEKIFLMFVYVLCCTVCITNTVVFGYIKKNIKILVEIFEKCTLSFDNDSMENKTRIEKCQWKCNKASKYLVVASEICFTGAFFLGLYLDLFLSHMEKLHLPYDITQSPFYELTLLYYLILTMQNLMVQISLITLTILLMVHLNLLWKLLHSNLQCINIVSVKVVQDDVTNDESLRNSASRPIITMEIQEFGNRNYLRIIDSTEIGDDILWRVYQGQVQGGSGHLEGDSQEPAVESVEYERREANTPGLDSYDEEESLASFSPAVDQEMQTRLAKCVQQHSDLISLTNNFVNVLDEHLVSWFILYSFTLAALTLMIMKLYNKDLWLTVLFIMLDIFTSLSYLLYCYMADNISSLSEEVGQALYDCDWLRASRSFKKKLLIAMTAANVPVSIKPTCLDPLSMKLYGEVNNNAYKMITSIQSFIK